MTQPHHRRTRIVATLGPATDPPEVLEAVLRAGVDVVRLNFSHGDPSAQVARGEVFHRLATCSRLNSAVRFSRSSFFNPARRAERCPSPAAQAAVSDVAPSVSATS